MNAMRTRRKFHAIPIVMSPLLCQTESDRGNVSDKFPRAPEPSEKIIHGCEAIEYKVSLEMIRRETQPGMWRGKREMLGVRAEGGSVSKMFGSQSFCLAANLLAINANFENANYTKTKRLELFSKLCLELYRSDMYEARY